MSGRSGTYGASRPLPVRVYRADARMADSRTDQTAAHTIHLKVGGPRQEQPSGPLGSFVRSRKQVGFGLMVDAMGLHSLFGAKAGSKGIRRPGEGNWQRPSE